MPQDPSPTNVAVSRRTLIQGTVIAGCVAAASTTNITSIEAASPPAKAKLEPGSVVLFQGDSITDAGRSRKSSGPNNASGLGRGYPYLIAGGLLADHGASNLRVYNRGISGHKVPDLDARWQKDTIDLKPAVLSILIGVNDIWHKLAGRYKGTVQDYQDGLAALLERTQKALPETRIVICEPFVLRCGAVTEKWFPEFDQRLAAARKVAKDTKLTLVPFQEMFDKAIKEAAPKYWAGDGVHPTLAGHALMAKTWREVVGL